MNTLILSEDFPSPIRPYAGTFVAEQARALGELVQVTVIAPISLPLPRRKFQEERKSKGKIPYRGSTHGVCVFYPRYLDWPRFSEYLNAYSMAASVLRCILRNRIKIDVIHSHYAYYAGFVGCLLGKILHRPVVVTVHGFDVNLYLKALPGYQDIYGVTSNQVADVRGRRALWALQQCTRVIAVSEELKERIIGLGIPPQKVVTIRNGVNLERFWPTDQVRAREKLGLAPEGKILLFIGNLLPGKDPASLILAFEKVRASCQDGLLVIGGGGFLRERLELLVRERRLESAVRFLGIVPYDMVPIWMNACDVFVLPTIYESFGVVLLEALACGKPIVTTHVGGIPEIFQDGVHGRLIEPKNPDILANAISDVLSREWDPQRLVCFAQNHSWQSVARQLYACYQEIVGCA